MNYHKIFQKEAEENEIRHIQSKKEQKNTKFFLSAVQFMFRLFRN
jgi:hypothetical protein